jgi:hydrogenase/urease accessory protein HupE
MKIMFLLLPMIALAAFIDVTAAPVINTNIAHQFPYPLNGMTPVLVLLCVGLLSARYSGNWKWALPAIFVLVFSVGLGAGMRSALPFSQTVNFAIIASLLISGLLTLTGCRPPLLLVVPLFVAVAWVHGFSHGALVSWSGIAIRQSREIVCAVSILLLSGLAADAILRLLAGHWSTPLSAREPIAPHETP